MQLLLFCREDTIPIRKLGVVQLPLIGLSCEGFFVSSFFLLICKIDMEKTGEEANAALLRHCAEIGCFIDADVALY